MKEKVVKRTVTLGERKYSIATVGKGKPTFVLLGWSVTINDFPFELVFQAGSEFLERHQLIFIHLSNFSDSSISEAPLTLLDYVNEIEQLRAYLNLDTVSMIGHSAGGRLALYYAHTYPDRVERLVLVSSAGLKHKAASNRMLSKVKAHFGRLQRLPRNVIPILKQTFQNIYNTDVTPFLPELTVPTLIVWGKADATISVSRGYRMKSLIPNAKLFVYPDQDHMLLRQVGILEDIFAFIENVPLTGPYPSLANINPKVIESTPFYQNILKISDEINRDLFIYPLEREELAQVTQNNVLILQALHKLTYYCLQQNNSLLSEMHLDRLPIPALLSRSSEIYTAYGRIDTLFNGERFQILEVNARRPQLFEDHDWLVNRLPQEAHPTQPVSDSIAQAYYSYYALNQNREPEVIVVISRLIAKLEREGIGSSLLQSIKRRFTQSKILLVDGEEGKLFYENLNLRQNKLYFKKIPIDYLIHQDIERGPYRLYSRGGRLKHPHIQTAYKKKELEIANPPSAKIIGSKVALSMLFDSYLQQKIGLTQAEKETLRLEAKSRYFKDAGKMANISLKNKVVKYPLKVVVRVYIWGMN